MRINELAIAGLLAYSSIFATAALAAAAKGPTASVCEMVIGCISPSPDEDPALHDISVSVAGDCSGPAALQQFYTKGITICNATGTTPYSSCEIAPKDPDILLCWPTTTP